MSPDLDPISWAQRLHDWGSQDLAFDALMAIGPVVVLTLVVAGRSTVTSALAAAYVAGFVVALARNILRGEVE